MTAGNKTLPRSRVRGERLRSLTNSMLRQTQQARKRFELRLTTRWNTATEPARVMQICSCTNVCGSVQIYQSVRELSPETGLVMQFPRMALDHVHTRSAFIAHSRSAGTRKVVCPLQVLASTAIQAAAGQYAQVLTVSRPLIPLGWLPKGLVK